MAVKQDLYALIPRLVEAGAYIDYVNRAGYTALHLAVSHCKVYCVKKLLLCGVNPNFHSLKATTPYEQALNDHSLEIIALLAECRGNPNQLDKKGNSICGTFIQTAYPTPTEARTVLTLMLEGKHPLKLDLLQGKGESYLQLALRAHNLPIVASLLEHGIEINSTSKQTVPVLRDILLYTNEDMWERFFTLNLRLPVKTQLGEYDCLLQAALLRGQSLTVKQVYLLVATVGDRALGCLQDLQGLVSPEVFQWLEGIDRCDTLAAWSCRALREVIIVKHQASLLYLCKEKLVWPRKLKEQILYDWKLPQNTSLGGQCRQKGLLLFTGNFTHGTTTVDTER